MRVVVVTPPEPLVSLDEAREHLGWPDREDDAMIEGMVAAISAHIDGPEAWLGRCIGMQTLEARCDTFPSCGFFLPFPPIVDVVSLSYVDAAGATQYMLPDAFDLFGVNLAPAYSTAWPSARLSREAVRIRYRAGYCETPKPVRAAVLLMVEDLYRNRGEAVIGTISSKVTMGATVDTLLSSFQVYR